MENQSNNQNWEELEQKNRKRGAFVTAGFHIGLILLFLIFGLSYPFPPPPERGVMINFGTELTPTEEAPPTRTGERPPQEVDPSEVQPVDPVDVQPDPVQPVETEVATQDRYESVPMPVEESRETPKERETVTETRPAEPEPEPDPVPDIDFDRVWGSRNADNQDATTYSDGSDRSAQTTDPAGGRGGDNIVFNEDGTIGYDLGGRSMLSSPTLTTRSREGGKVVLNIIVDQYGNLVGDPTFRIRGSTTNNPNLIRQAIDAAKQIKFNSDPNAPFEQRGTVTFNFRLN